jgi:hypothetical protein
MPLAEENPMLWTIATILILLWAFGLVCGYTMGPFIHILLVFGLLIFLIRIIQGRRRVKPSLDLPHDLRTKS